MDTEQQNKLLEQLLARTTEGRLHWRIAPAGTERYATEIGPYILEVGLAQRLQRGLIEPVSYAALTVMDRGRNPVDQIVANEGRYRLPAFNTENLALGEQAMLLLRLYFEVCRAARPPYDCNDLIRHLEALAPETTA